MDGLYNSWSVLNRNIGRKIVMIPYSTIYKNVYEKFKDYLTQYILTPDEVIKYKVSRNRGFDEESPINPLEEWRLKDPKISRRPSYWVVTNPFYSLGQVIAPIEKIVLSDDYKEEPIRKIGEINGVSILYHSPENKTYPEYAYDQDGLIKMLFEKDMKPAGGYY